jgi:acyl-CoA synthetase (AMP-forming)/AMP-acid ligase II
MIISGGEKVYCGEVEAVIYEIPVVREAAVFGIPDPRRTARCVRSFATRRISFRAGVDPSLPAIVTGLQDSTAGKVSQDGLTEDCRRQCAEANAS